MLRVLSKVSVLCVMCLMLPGFTFPGGSASAPESFSPLVERLSPAVVNISTTQKVVNGAQPNMQGMPPEMQEFFRRFGVPGSGAVPRSREVTSLGSGFVIDPAGYVVTNNHVIDGAQKITVTFPDNAQFEASVVGRDDKTDLALLKIKSNKQFPHVQWGNSDAVQVGDWVLAIGNPYGLGGTVTAGIISARSRDIQSGPFDDFLQTDAAINRGNSGGPMFNTDGQVIGINTAIFSPSGGSVGIGFAVPSVMAKSVIAQLKQYGHTKRGWLGVQIQAVTPEMAGSMGLKKARGALVVDVQSGSPAERAGLKAGDVILGFAGKTIEAMRELPRLVAQVEHGSSQTIEIWRSGKKMQMSLVLGQLEGDATHVQANNNTEDDAQVPRGQAILGMQLAEITPALRARFRLPSDTQGLLVLAVESDSVASERGIRPGTVLTAYYQQSLQSVAQFKTIIQQLQKNQQQHILLRVKVGDSEAYITLPL